MLATIWPVTVAKAALKPPPCGEAQQAKNHDGVQDNVDDRAQHLGTHGIQGASGGLKQPLKHDLEKLAEG